MYRATVDGAQFAKLKRGGYDVSTQRPALNGTQVELVLTRGQRDSLAAQGVQIGLIKNGKGQTVRQQAALMAVGGYNVFRSYDEAGGIRDELYAIAAKNPNTVKLVVIGRTVQGREIIALKVTKNGSS